MEDKKVFDKYYKLNALKVYDIQKRIQKNKKRCLKNKGQENEEYKVCILVDNPEFNY